MRTASFLVASWVVLMAGAASAQTKPSQPLQPLGPTPSGGVLPAAPVGQVPQAAPTRGALYIPQFAPPGVQVPGGPPATNTPTLITPTILGRY